MLGGLVYWQSNRIWDNTSNLYDHPLQIARATRDIKTDILSMQMILMNAAADEKLSWEQLFEISNKLKDYEANITKSFNIVFERYLGPREDIDNSYNIYKTWKNSCDEVIELRMRGDNSTANARFKSEILTYSDLINRHIQVMIDFAIKKSDVFYFSAEKEKNTLFFRLWLVTGTIFLLTVIFAYFLIHGIRGPLKNLTRIAELYRKGDYDARVSISSTDEIGVLAEAFNEMAQAVQNELNLKENAAFIAEVIANENDLKSFCSMVLKTLLTRTRAQIAAIYFLDTDKKLYEHFDSIGLSTKNIKSFSADSNEGEFGSVLATKKIQRITQIPAGTAFNFSVVTGDFIPREIITIPIIENDIVVAIISLASLHTFAPSAVQLIKEIWLALTARINGVRLFQKVTDFSAKLDHQNKELTEKTNELMMQSDELKEYNIELELQKKQLDEANQLKSAFLSNMSHELRTPLNSVIALSGVLSRRLKNFISEDEYSYIDIIEKNGKQLLSLINDILDLSRIEAGKEDMNFSEFSVYNLVKSNLELVSQMSSEKGIALINNISPQIIPIISDSNKCNHILQNIISNAIKFTEKGSVEISAIQEKDFLRISIKDTGIGIAPEHIPFIFDEFRQVDEKASRRFGGTGLGLAIAKKYSLLLNGYIEVESEPGKGSTFTVILPVAPADHLLEKTVRQTPASSRHIYSTIPTLYNPFEKTILLVEDSEPQIIQLTDILKQEGYKLQVARNGKEALESISVSIPDALILDLMMPEVNGFEVLASIRNLKETKRIPVLILSAKHVTKQELSFLHENNIFQLIQKGDINRNELLAHIRTMVHSSEKETPEPGKIKPLHRTNTTKPIILLIEDNPDNNITVKALLSGRFEISEAVDGPGGLEKARKLIPDLILLDISLPGMDGFEVLDEIKKDLNLKNVPVIALTARAMTGDRENILGYGFDDYISKPIENDLFEKSINEWFYGK